ncbi:MAG: hypothetical protein JWP85_999 [Rhodoglobus sp.]|nr:hypothetical protein [Rhodoglobus sp.]
MLSKYPAVRVAIYLLAVASQIASFFVFIVNKDLASAFVSTSSVLTAIAGVTALTNITPVTSR